MSAAARLIKDIVAHRELLGILVVRNVKIRYKNSALGFFWSLLGPLFMILIYSVFLKVLKVQIELPVLVTGILVWQFLAMCMGDSLHAIVGNSNLVTKAAFPRIVLPLAMVASNLFNFALSLVVLFGYLLIAGTSFGAAYWLPLVILSQCALCAGVALIFSSFNVFYRDMEHILSMVMLAWFFMSPVIYPIEFVLDRLPVWAEWLYFLNPMAGLVTCYRMVLLDHGSPGDGYLVAPIVVGWVVLVLGVVVFQKLQPKFGDEL